DVELAYRFKKNGWKSMVLHEAIAYHNRSFFRHSHRQQKISTQLRSYRNHLWILFMHLSFIDWIKYGWAIIPFELVKIVYWFVYQPKIIFETFKQTNKNWKNLMHKRIFYASLRYRHNNGLTQRS
ncbi:hypothetical protein CO172_03770, partial [Candidatus Uhrbacteria bacterium CG_4_9_14_3_um_filter_36_7]